MTGSTCYVVTGTDANGCQASDTVCIQVDPDGLDELQAAGFSVMPNPTSDDLLVTFDMAQRDVELVLYDALGQAVMTRSFDGITAGNRLTLNLSSLPSATYFLYVKSASAQATVSVVVH